MEQHLENYLHQVRRVRPAVRNSGSISVIEGLWSSWMRIYDRRNSNNFRDVGDNFGAGMTGGMAFVYDKNKNFENFVNPTSIIWQSIETNYWRNFLKEKITEFYDETKSKLAEKILNNFDAEFKNFIQICPIEMLDKIENPITLKDLKTKSA